MSYCTISDIYKVLPQDTVMRLTDDESTGAVDEAKVTEAIESGAEEIDSYLGSRYDLPLSSTPPVLGRLNADIAAYNLYARVKEDIPATRQTRYDNAIKFLQKVADGKLTLGIQPPPDPPESGDYEKGSQVEARTKVFDATTMNKY
jgi:phage gp36-like protein